MAMVSIIPLEVSVSCGWLDGRPRSIRLAHGSIPVLAVVRTRTEAAAYPPRSGPRTLFDVETPDGVFSLGYEHRRRRWILNGVDAPLAAVAERVTASVPLVDRPARLGAPAEPVEFPRAA